MRFLSAGALWWLALSAVIIFFYLLKIRRKRRVVPSVFLWQRALEELEANTPFRKLRRSLLLLLQLIILAAIVFALARPLIKTNSLASGSTIIIIDSTASMGAKDADGRTRLELAKEKAREMVASLGGSDQAAIIESSSRVTLRSPISSDRSSLTSAIDDIAGTDAAGNLADAMQLAEQMAKAGRDASIIVISDGGGANSISQSSPVVSNETTSIRFARVGERANNAGIVALNSRPSPTGARRELFASIANFGEAREIGVELRIDGTLIDAQNINMETNGRSALVFDALPQSGGLVELKIAVEDDLAGDNIAYTMLPNSRRPRVGIISENPFLIRAFAVNGDIEARRLDSSGDISEIDCIVVENTFRTDLLENRKPVLAINPPDSAPLWQTTGGSEQPGVTSFDRAHPLNAYLSYADIHIENAPLRNVAAWLKPVVSSGNDGLIWAGEDEGRRVVLLGFDLVKSDLPLKVEFPILLANSISWLTGRDQANEERAIRAGSSVTIRAAAENATVTLPDGETRNLATTGGSAVFAETMRAGLYGVEGTVPFAASLLSESESDTTPRDSIQTRAGEISGQAETFLAEREIWKWIALIALAVLAIEWWVYHRRVAV